MNRLGQTVTHGRYEIVISFSDCWTDRDSRSSTINRQTKIKVGLNLTLRESNLEGRPEVSDVVSNEREFEMKCAQAKRYVPHSEERTLQVAILAGRPTDASIDGGSNGPCGQIEFQKN